MNRFITLLIVSLSTILLIACSNQSSNSLDGEYYWINESRKERLMPLQLIKIVQQSN